MEPIRVLLFLSSAFSSAPLPIEAAASSTAVFNCPNWPIAPVPPPSGPSPFSPPPPPLNALSVADLIPSIAPVRPPVPPVPEPFPLSDEPEVLPFGTPPPEIADTTPSTAVFKSPNCVMIFLSRLISPSPAIACIRLLTLSAPDRPMVSMTSMIAAFNNANCPMIPSDSLPNVAEFKFDSACMMELAGESPLMPNAPATLPIASASVPNPSDRPFIFSLSGIWLRLSEIAPTLAATSPVFVAVSPREVLTFPTPWLDSPSLLFISSNLALESANTVGAVPSYPDSSWSFDSTSAFPSLSLKTTSMYAFFSFSNSSAEPFKSASSSMPNCCNLSKLFLLRLNDLNPCVLFVFKGFNYCIPGFF